MWSFGSLCLGSSLFKMQSRLFIWLCERFCKWEFLFSGGPCAVVISWDGASTNCSFRLRAVAGLHFRSILRECEYSLPNGSIYIYSRSLGLQGALSTLWGPDMYHDGNTGAWTVWVWVHIKAPPFRKAEGCMPGLAWSLSGLLRICEDIPRQTESAPARKRTNLALWGRLFTLEAKGIWATVS